MLNSTKVSGLKANIAYVGFFRKNTDSNLLKYKLTSKYLWQNKCM